MKDRRIDTVLRNRICTLILHPYPTLEDSSQSLQCTNDHIQPNLFGLNQSIHGFQSMEFTAKQPDREFLPPQQELYQHFPPGSLFRYNCVPGCHHRICNIPRI